MQVSPSARDTEKSRKPVQDNHRMVFADSLPSPQQFVSLLRANSARALPCGLLLVCLSARAHSHLPWGLGEKTPWPFAVLQPDCIELGFRALPEATCTTINVGLVYVGK